MIHLLQILSLPEALSFVCLWNSKKPIIRFKVRGIPTALYCRRDSVDHKVVWQIFGLKDCQVNLNTQPRLIVDGGAHVGYASVYFANRFPSALILAVEPSLKNIEIFRMNTREYTNVRLVHGAIWDRSEALVIIDPSAFETGYQVNPAGAEITESFPGLTISEILRIAGEARIDLLKLDIEGAEERIFLGGETGWLDSVQAVLVEIHREEAVEPIVRTMMDNGFEFKKTAEKYFFYRCSETRFIV